MTPTLSSPREMGSSPRRQRTPGRPNPGSPLTSRRPQLQTGSKEVSQKFFCYKDIGQVQSTV
jgi:hypothetical protein